VRPGLERFVVRLGEELELRGVAVSPRSLVTFTKALALVAGSGRSAIYWAGRATLLTSPDDVDAYDRAFLVWWDAASPAPGSTRRLEETFGFDLPPDEASGDDDARNETAPDVSVRWSSEEVLRHRDFAECSPTELDAIFALMGSLQLAVDLRPVRRIEPTRGGHGTFDTRRTARGALRTGGEIVRHRHTRQALRPRRVVLLVDVSGSMEPYALAMVRFAQVLVAARRRDRVKVEVFSIGTRLTRLTLELGGADPDAAFRAVGAAVPDWSGGTRLGDTIGQFVQQWGAVGMARGAEIVVMSDGWDRGDPTHLAEQMGRLARLAHRVTWVNPLRATPGYAPLAAGMAAALPFVDRFIDGHNLAAIESLAALLGQRR